MGFRKRSQEHRESSTNGEPVAKLFFDSFSTRLAQVERGLKTLSTTVESLKASSDRSQISDLVLLERLERAEEMLTESLSWIKRVADKTYEQSRGGPWVGTELGSPSRAIQDEPLEAPVQPIVHVAEAGSLASNTTQTELQVLSLLVEKGPMSAPEIGKVIGRSREHTARLMRKLFDEGYLRRDQTRTPFRYSLVERVRQSFRKSESKTEQRETLTVPQT